MFKAKLDDSLIYLKTQSLHTIVSDYDRTLTDEFLNPFEPALEAIELLKRDSKIKFMIASGRRLNFFLNQAKIIQLTDAIVAENGAVLHIPKDHITLIFEEEFASFIKEIFLSSSLPIEEGQVIISVKRIFEREVKRILKERGLKVELEYNKDSLMILPTGINKAFGVKKALSKLGLNEEGILCIGDGENDLSLFEIAAIKVATADAIKELKDKADVVCLEPMALGVTRFLNFLTLKFNLSL
ncbi:MAG: phosphoglycolate phosphatase [Nitrososphaerales archaeon]